MKLYSTNKMVKMSPSCVQIINMDNKWETLYRLTDSSARAQ